MQTRCGSSGFSELKLANDVMHCVEVLLGVLPKMVVFWPKMVVSHIFLSDEISSSSNIFQHEIHGISW